MIGSYLTFVPFIQTRQTGFFDDSECDAPFEQAAPLFLDFVLCSWRVSACGLGKSEDAKECLDP